jgi:hypothetical protein
MVAAAACYSCGGNPKPEAEALMVKRILSFLRQLVGGKGMAPEPRPAGETEERRIRVRYPSNVHVHFQAVNGSLGARLTARVRNISLGGVSLIVGHRFTPGDLLSIELPQADGRPGATVLACVVHVTPQPSGEWALGCNFIRELSDDELKALL